MDPMETGIDEFFGAYEGTDGNQTEPAEVTEEPTQTEQDPDVDPAGEEQEPPEGAETSGEVTEEAGKDGAAGNPEPGKDSSGKEDPEQRFTIKVNKEEREVSLPEITELAQKGADYDRVKGQLEAERQSKDSLQAELDKQKPYMEILELAAEQTGIPIEKMLEEVHVSLLTARGMTEKEAKAEIRAAKAEHQVKAMTDQKEKPEPEKDSGAERAQEEVAAFAAAYPDVRLTEELVEKLMPDVRSGMSLTNAYQKLLNEQKAAELQQKEQEIKAAQQNKRNRAKSPGSQQDSGGQRKKDAFDDFFDAYEK